MFVVSFRYTSPKLAPARPAGFFSGKFRFGTFRVEMGDEGWDLKYAKTAPPPQQVAMLARAGPGAQGPQVQGPRAHHQVGLMAQGPEVHGHKGKLGIGLGGRKRLSKPRSIKEIGEIGRESSQHLSIPEIVVQFGITDDTELD